MAKYYDDDDFIVSEHGTLEEYDGEGGAVTVPSGVQRIAKSAFSGNTDITKIKLPKSVKVIEDGAFEGCSSLADKSGYVIVGGVLYDYFGSASYLVVPSNINSISERAFYNCTSIITLQIPDSVVSVGAFAFCGCSFMVSVELACGITSIGKNAFMMCDKLQRITYAGNRAEWEQITESAKLCIQSKVEVTCIDD